MSSKFISHKDEVLDDLHSAISRGLEIIGGMAEGYAKENITRNRSVVTGRLRASIAHAPESDKTMVVGTNVEYAPYVELGTRKQQAKPYLRPAGENHRKEYVKVMENELK